MSPGYGCLSVVNVVCCHLEVFATGRFLVQSSPRFGVCVRARAVFVRACVNMSLNVSKCDNNPLHLQRVGSRGQTEKE